VFAARAPPGTPSGERSALLKPQLDLRSGERGENKRRKRGNKMKAKEGQRKNEIIYGSVLFDSHFCLTGERNI